MQGKVLGPWRKEWECGGKVRVLWKKDGSVGKGKSALEKGWECGES